MPHTTTTDNNHEREPRSPIEAMMRGRFMEPVTGLELLRRIMPAAEVVQQNIPQTEEVRRHQSQVETLIDERIKTDADLRLEQIRAQVQQEAA